MIWPKSELNWISSRESSMRNSCERELYTSIVKNECIEPGECANQHTTFITESLCNAHLDLTNELKIRPIFII